MLERLTVHNYALIQELAIDYAPGLNIITGETGAGKSILLGALGMLLGKRAETNVILNPEKKCSIEGVFRLSEETFAPLFEENEMDFEPETIIRREISPKGKSRAFVNDSPVRLEALRAVGERLVDIHSQHQTLQLNDPAFQLELVDSIAQNRRKREAVAETLSHYRQANKQRRALEEKQAEFARQRDFLQYQLEEIQHLAPQAGEENQLEEELQLLSNAEQIRTTLEQAEYYLDTSEDSISSRLSELLRQFEGLKGFNEALGQFHERLESLHIESQDLGQEIASYKDQVEVDNQRLEEVNERLAQLNTLLKKHQLQNADELIALQDKLASQLTADEESGERIAELRKEEERLLGVLQEQVEALRESRLSVFPLVEEQLVRQLRQLGMPHATVKIDHQAYQAHQADSSGADRVQLLFAANKGVAPEPVQRVASGGELSRIMLSIKSLLADAHLMPTMIFDEIDTGISGEIAQQVGELLEELAQHHQVVVITHMPQIAARGRSHFFIYKDSSGEVTETRMRPLDGEERVGKIASMISGDRPSTLAMESARELLSENEAG
jgi:DNA repair protein RecN (Recombination protein N)